MMMLGIPAIKVVMMHSQRHEISGASLPVLLHQGIRIKVVQERLGHADITLTLNTYSHVIPSMQDEAAEKLDELLTVLDVSDEIKKIGEHKAVYNSEKWMANKVNNK